MSEPFWNRVYLGSSERMSEIPDASVQMVVTSPPYFGLRDYGGSWEGGDAACAHVREKLGASSTLHAKAAFNGKEIYRSVCGRCGATWPRRSASRCRPGRRCAASRDTAEQFAL